MAFVAVVLGLLGSLIIGGFVVLLAKLGALADELREARTKDGGVLAAQLEAIADRQQGMRLDLDAHRKSIEGLTHQLEGPPSLRRPPRMFGVTGADT